MNLSSSPKEAEAVRLQVRESHNSGDEAWCYLCQEIDC